MKQSNLETLLLSINKRAYLPERVFICDTQELANEYNVKIGTTIHESIIPKLVVEKYEN